MYYRSVTATKSGISALNTPFGLLHQSLAVRERYPANHSNGWTEPVPRLPIRDLYAAYRHRGASLRCGLRWRMEDVPLFRLRTCFARRVAPQTLGWEPDDRL